MGSLAFDTRAKFVLGVVLTLANVACGARTSLESDTANESSGGATLHSTFGNPTIEGGYRAAMGGTTGHTRTMRGSGAGGNQPIAGGASAQGGAITVPDSGIGGLTSTETRTGAFGGNPSVGGTSALTTSTPAGGNQSGGTRNSSLTEVSTGGYIATGGIGLPGGSNSVGGAATGGAGGSITGGTVATSTGGISATLSTGSGSGGVPITSGGATSGAGGSVSSTDTTASSGGSSVCRFSACDVDAGETCVDLDTDPDNCGVCGRSCKPGWSCVSGQCQRVCKDNFVFTASVLDVSYNYSGQPSSIVSADFNGDGLPDLAVSDPSGVVSVLIGEPHAKFKDRVTYAVGASAQQLVSVDLNGDAKLDLITANSSKASSVSILFGNGDGTFGGLKALGPGNESWSLAVGDLNEDSIPDLVTDSVFNSKMSIFLGKGGGAFSPPVDHAAIASVESLHLLDFNGDNHLDVAGLDGFGDLAVFPGNGDGTLGNASLFGVGTFASSIKTADLNDDGRRDIVVMQLDQRAITVMIVDGHSWFTSFKNYPIRGHATDVSFGDLNRDGIVDIAVSDNWGGEIGVLIGIGDGTFKDELVYPIGAAVIASAVADFSGDGLLDLAAVDYVNSAVTLLYGNGDGSFDVSMHFPMVSCPTGATWSDVNKDGELDFVTSNADPTISVYLGPIRQPLSANATYDIGSNPSGVAIHDLDADGLEDLLVKGGLYGSPVSIFFGTGNGQFGNRKDLDASKTLSQVVADVDQDGLPDIVSLNGESPTGPYTFSTTMNLGLRSFAAPLGSVSSDVVYDYSLGDINGDHLPDLVFTTDTTLQIAFGTGSGTFATPIRNAGGSFGMKLGDMNRDGKLDVVIPSCNLDVVRVFLGHGDGTFAAARELAAGDCPTRIGLNDVNGDGSLDVVVANFDGTVSLLLGNGDGTFASSGDSGYGVAVSYVHDINGDGWPDVAAVNGGSCELTVLYGKCR